MKLAKVLKTLFLGLIITLGFLSAGSAVAQENNDDSIYDGSLFVSNILINQKDLLNGDTIDGTFNIHNVTPVNISGVRYRVELVQIFEDVFEYEDADGNVTDSVNFDQITESFAVSGVSGALNLEPGATNVPFSYKIPRGVPEGRIGLLVQLYSADEIKSGYEFTEINVGGSRISYVLATGQLSVYENGTTTPQVFEALEGPVVNNKEKVEFNVFFQNNSGNGVALTPYMKVFSGNNPNGELILSKQYSSINLVPNELKKSHSLPAPLDLKPGVYTAVIEYVDSSGLSRTYPMEFRYIIEGIKPKIGEVVYNTTDLTITDEFLVKVSYLDIPLSFRMNEDGTFKDARVQKFVTENKDFDINNLSESISEEIMNLNKYSVEGMKAVVQIFNSKTDSIIESREIVFDDTNEAVAGFDSFMEVDDLKVVVDLYQNDEIVDTYTENISVITNKYDTIFHKLWDMYQNIIVVSLSIILVIAVLLIVKFANRNRNIALSLVFSILMIGSSFVVTEKVEARGSRNKAVNDIHLKNDWIACGAKVFRGHAVVSSNSVNCGNDRRDTGLMGQVVVSNPKPPTVQTYLPTQKMSFMADFTFTYCTNSGYDLRTRMTKPVLVGNPHANYSDWQNLRKKTFLGANEAYPKLHPRFSGNINMPFDTPQQPGTYHFKYQVVVNSGGWYDVQEGTVKFEVALDSCANAGGTQTEVPRGYVQTRNANGTFNCVPADLGLVCSASKSRLNIGETVTFNGKVSDTYNANFKWFDGNSVNDELLKQDNNVNSSSYSTSYNNPGLYIVTVSAENASNPQQVCKVGVSVGEQFKTVPLDENSIDEYLKILEDNYIDEDGKRYPLIKTAAPGKIIFNMDDRLTNTTCAGDWVAENVLKCALYRNNVKVKDIEFTGEADFASGTYQVRCIQSNDGKQIVSETKVCRLNPDVRER